MAEFPFNVTQRVLLTAALDALRDLHDIKNCQVTARGNCATHEWIGPTACPQLRARLILKQVHKQPLPAAYAITILRAVLRGLAPGQEAHAQVFVNGYTHEAYLVAVTPPDAERGARPTGAFDIAAHLGCGAVVSPIDPQDVLALDVHDPRRGEPVPFDELLEQSSLGAPHVKAACAELTDQELERIHRAVDGEKE